MENDIILYALPVFGLLIAAELAYGAWRGRQTYRLNDTLSSLSQGLLSQAIAVCTQLFQIGLYTMLFRHFATDALTGFWRTAGGWVAAVVLFDFCDYWLHRAGHEVGIFWAAHVVHHQSEAFNFSTALRQESMVPFLGWMFYVPMAILGVPPAQFVVAGLIVLIYQFWIHTEHIGKLGWFDRVFSSPSNHRVHHAVNPGYLDKNYGGMLVIWDRLFGTFAEEREACVYGTTAPLASWNPLWAVASVYAGLAHEAMRAPRWRDKLRIWFKPPGWRPANAVASRDGMQPAAERTRFDPPLTGRQASFAIAQLLLMIVLTAVLLAQAEDLAWLRAMVLCGAIAAGLWLAGAVMESRLRVRRALMCNALLLLAAGCALPAFADSTLPDRLVGNVGAGVYASRTAERLPTESPFAFPFVYADYQRLYARVDTFGIKTAALGNGYLELAGRVSTDGFATGSVGGRHIVGRSNPLPIGIGTFQETALGGFFLYAFHDLRSHGSLLEGTYAAELAVGGVHLYPQLGVARRSAGYQQHLLGVTPEQASAAGLPVYTPGASVAPLAALAADLPLSGAWLLNLQWRRDWYGQAARRSPLGGNAHLDSGFVAVSYAFK